MKVCSYEFICACVNCLFVDGTAVAENKCAVTLMQLLIFFTGADHEPPLGFIPKPSMLFLEAELATAGTCEMGLRLPIIHDNYSIFKEKMILSLHGYEGFGQV